MRIFLFLIIILFAGAFLIISNQNIYINNPKSINLFIDGYFQWMLKIFDNSKKITSFVIKLDWFR
jgi:hypothetical protein